MTSLHAAAESGDLRAVRDALQRDPEAVHKLTKGYCETPLHRASVKGSAEIVAELLSAGADPHAQRSGGFTALHLAENIRVAETLLRAGADREARSAAGKTPAEHCAGGATVQQYIASFQPPAQSAPPIVVPPQTEPEPEPEPESTPPTSTPQLAPPSPSSSADPFVDERRRKIEELETQKAAAVASERYEEAGEIKAQIATVNEEIMEHLASGKFFSEDKCKADADQLKREGNARFKKKDWAGAIEKYTAAIAVDATVPAYLTNRAVCLIKLERWEEAKADGLAAAALAPAEGFAKGFLRAAQAAGGMNDYQGLRELLDDATAETICDPSIKIAHDTPALCCEAADCALRCGEHAAAIAEADKALEKDGQFPLAHVIKGDALVEQEEYRAGMKVRSSSWLVLAPVDSTPLRPLHSSWFTLCVLGRCTKRR